MVFKKNKILLSIFFIFILFLFLFFYKESLIISLPNIIIYEDQEIKNSNIDMVCVLGGGTVERAIKGLKLYNKYNPDFIVVTGDFHFWPEKKLNWSEMAEIFLKKRGVKSEKIIKLKSTSTNEDIKKIIDFMTNKKIKNAIIVSSLFHTGRIKRLLEKNTKDKNLNIYIKASNNFQYNKFNWYKQEKGVLFFFNEILKLFYYYFKGYI